MPLKTSQTFQKPPQFLYPFLIIISFLAWCFMVRVFLLGQSPLTYDAVPYYEHEKFLTGQLAQGVFPLWDPSRDTGVPNEFYLRRIGEFNPAYLMLIFFSKIGLNFDQGYLIFLAFYFWLGMIGFYRVAKLLLEKKRWAFLSYLILLFSSFGTTAFKSFMVFLFTPTVWFFYFFIAFIIRPHKFFLLGFSFCLMIILTTYIPFYFLTIFLSLAVMAVLINGSFLRKRWIEGWAFFKNQKLLSGLCLLLILSSCVPSLLFIKQFDQENMVLAGRQALEQDEHLLTVVKQSALMGGIPASLIGQKLFSNLENFQAGQFYLPIFVYILLLLGFCTRLNRLLSVLFLWGFFNFLLSLYDATPLYTFFYDHVFFFKYFRNFQFFLWLVVLPTIVLISVSHLKIFLEEKGNRFWERLIGISILHAGFLSFLIFTQAHIIMTSYLTVIISWIVFIVYEGKVKKSRQKIWRTAIFLLVVLQPLQVYQFLTKNSSPKTQGYRDVEPHIRFYTLDEKNRQDIFKTAVTQNQLAFAKEPFYLNSRWAIDLRKNVSPVVFAIFPQSPVAFYDQVRDMDWTNPNYKNLTKSLLSLDNVAYIHEDMAWTARKDSTAWGMVSKHDPRLEILKLSANKIALKTNLSDEKFLVYYDHYSPRWRAILDGQKEIPVVQANLAFKGVVVPAGQHMVDFIYGRTVDYVLKWMFLILFYSVFIILMIYAFRYNRVSYVKER